MQFIGIIPARYASTRFPGKPLVKIKGVSMIRRVYDQAKSAGLLSHVVVATDDKRIFDHVSAFGNVVYTSASHPSGTDRCFEATGKLATDLKLTSKDVIINIQGDEPFIHPLQIETLCTCFEKSEVEIATLIKKITDPGQLFNENVVKVVVGFDGRALYFSRAAIPVLRGVAQHEWLQQGVFYKHIGMYAYRWDVLSKITTLQPSFLEKSESLEQLRWLENGFSVFVKETTLESHSVDTIEDLAWFEKS